MILHKLSIHINCFIKQAQEYAN